MRIIAAALAAFLFAAGCGGDGDDPSTRSTPSPILTLPAGALSGLVAQPTEVGVGLVPIISQTGPADLKKIASFSADPARAEKTLREHGFNEAYVATYGDQQTGRVLLNVVSRFADEAGATADLTGDIEASKSGGTPFEVTDLGDQAAGLLGKQRPKEGTGELVTLRWRVGDTTFLLAVGAPGTVDRDGVISLAKKLAERA